jgi:Ca2+-binding EF-hand superfamily protein
LHRRTTLAITAALAAAGSTYAAENPGKVYSALMPQTRADAQSKVKAMFDRIDANHDGVITRDEFDAWRAARLAEWQAKSGERRDKAFAAIDSDHSGQISKAEFDAAAQSGQGRLLRHMARARMDNGGGWFDRVDTNHDNRVTLDEAQNAAMAIFDEADTDHNGTVTPQERRQAWARMRGAGQQN